MGVLIMRAYHHSRKDSNANKILIPDSAHGTNPATTSMSGMEVVGIPSDTRGNVDLEALKAACDDTLVGLMLTNPNTFGLFDEHVEEVVKIVHAAGGLVYGDGANLNALLGIVRPGDLGIDVMHFNLHKTFSTPHGGGGPGSGPVGVAKHLVDFLPSPLVAIIEEGDDENAPLYGLLRSAQFHWPDEIFPWPFWNDRSGIYLHPDARSGRTAQDLRVCCSECQLPVIKTERRIHCRMTGSVCMSSCWKGIGRMRPMCTRWILPSD